MGSPSCRSRCRQNYMTIGARGQQALPTESGAAGAAISNATMSKNLTSRAGYPAGSPAGALDRSGRARGRFHAIDGCLESEVVAGREELAGERRRGHRPDLVAERCGGDEAGLGRALGGADAAPLDAGAMGVPVGVMLMGAGGFLRHYDLQIAFGPSPGACVGHAWDDGKDEYEE